MPVLRGGIEHVLYVPVPNFRRRRTLFVHHLLHHPSRQRSEELPVLRRDAGLDLSARRLHADGEYVV